VYEGPREEIYGKSTQGTTLKSTFSGYNAVAIVIRLAVVASKRLRNPAKFYENSNL